MGYPIVGSSHLVSSNCNNNSNHTPQQPPLPRSAPHVHSLPPLFLLAITWIPLLPRNSPPASAFFLLHAMAMMIVVMLHPLCISPPRPLANQPTALSHPCQPPSSQALTPNSDPQWILPYHHRSMARADTGRGFLLFSADSNDLITLLTVTSHSFHPQPSMVWVVRTAVLTVPINPQVRKPASTLTQTRRALHQDTDASTGHPSMQRLQTLLMKMMAAMHLITIPAVRQPLHPPLQHNKRQWTITNATCIPQCSWLGIGLDSPSPLITTTTTRHTNLWPPHPTATGCNRTMPVSWRGLSLLSSSSGSAL